MKFGTKLLLLLLGIVVLAVGVYQGYIFIHYRAYDGYRQYMAGTSGDYEEGTAFKALNGGGDVPDMVLAADNGILRLYVDTASTNAAVYDTRTGAVTYACPPDADGDPVASVLNKERLKSPLEVEYFTANRNPGRYHSWKYAIEPGQFEIKSLNDGFRVIYTMGDMTVTTGIVPVYIHEDRLNIFLDRMDEKTRNDVSMRYMDSTAAPDGFLELREGAKGIATIRKLAEALIEAGYTEEDLLEDSLASGVEGAVPVSFTVEMEYRLDGDSLEVSVPTGRIIETGGAKIDKIHILRSFGAAGTGEDGYMLVPNGSGSIIRFNNGKGGPDDYWQYVYGQDPLNSDYIVLGNTEDIRLPVFGLQKENGGIFAQIEQGQSFAVISAAVSGESLSYNCVFPVFTVRGSSNLAMFGITGNEADMTVVERDIYDCDLTVRYSFLTEEHDGYSGMARYYRGRLEREGVLSGRAADGDIPLYLDLIGAVSGTKFVFSVPYLGIVPMTTYEQAAEITDIFSAAGVSNQVVNLQGWFNRGYYHDVPDKIKPVRKLGSKTQLEDLSAKLEGLGGKLYTEAAIQRVTFISKRFKYAIETSRYYGGGMVAARAQVSPVAYRATTTLGYLETAYDLISPKFLPRYIDKFIGGIGKYGVTGVSLRDLGDELHSDRKRTEFIDREQSLSVVKAQLGKIDGSGMDVMVSGGNVYAFRGADDLINVPLAHNKFYVVDEEVPFYQMVVHGYIPYAGYSYNQSNVTGEDDVVLRLLEYGAAPHFTLTYEEASEMKYTGLSRMYGTCYLNWTDTAIGLYNTVNSVLSKVSGSFITEHLVTAEGLRCVTYENGVQIVVNRTAGDLEYQGVTVPSGGYAVREGVTA